MESPLNAVQSFLESKIDRYEKALVEISQKEGKVFPSDCCENKTCDPVYESDEKGVRIIAPCDRHYGVAAAYSDCARIAKEALENK